MMVRVQNSDRNHDITGLLDTGCNVDVISKHGCHDLGIDGSIKYCSKNQYKASGVDGHRLPVIGTIRTKLYIGDVPYETEFQVLDHIQGYDMMIGTQFMKANGILNDIYECVSRRLGDSNVRKGN